MGEEPSGLLSVLRVGSRVISGPRRSSFPSLVLWDWDSREFFLLGPRSQKEVFPLYTTVMLREGSIREKSASFAYDYLRQFYLSLSQKTDAF